MDKSIRKQLIGYFLAFSLLLSFIFIGSGIFIVRRSFDQYKENNINLSNQQIVNYIIRNYDLENGYSSDLASNLITMIQQRQVDLTIYDQTNQVIWSKTYGQGHMGNMGHMKKRGNLTTSQYPLVKDDIPFGSVEIRRSGSTFLTQEDALFLRNLFTGTLIASFIGLVIAFFIGLRFAKGLSKPITQLKDVTQGITAGNLSLRVQDQSKIIEYKELSTAINNMVETLEKQRILRRTLANNISHELRTPLYVMKTHVEALSDGIIDGDEEAYQTLQGEIHQLSHIVADLEQLNDLEEDTKLILEQIDLNAFLKSFVQSYESICESQHKELILNVDMQINLSLDSTRMKQVLTNLMANALRFTEKDDKIYLLAKEDRKQVTIYFKDTGHGISENDMPYVFERFYRSAIKNNTLENGAGLGLSIVKEIVALHGGQISVSSIEGQYTEFKISLPLMPSS